MQEIARGAGTKPRMARVATRSSLLAVGWPPLRGYVRRTSGKSRALAQPKAGDTVIRWADAADVEAIADIWHRSWHETYGWHVPAKLAELNDLAFFECLAAASLFEHDSSQPPESRVTRPTALVAARGEDGISGFAVVRGGALLHAMYVAREAHSTGLAAKLLAEVEHVMHHERGAELAHLGVVTQNVRARRFYEKHGWEGPAPHALAGAAPISTAPWVAAHPDELAGRRRLSQQELDAAGIPVTTPMKKFLGPSQASRDYERRLAGVLTVMLGACWWVG